METMELPAQIQRQLDQAAEIERKMQVAASPAPEGNTEETVAPAPVDEPFATQQPEAEQEIQVTKPEVSEDTWQQKFYVLRGKYDAEVPRLNAQVKELAQQLQELLLQQQEVAQEPVREPDTQKLVTDNDVEAYGADFIEAMRRVAREESERATRASRKEVDEQVKTVKERIGQTEAQRFWATVKTAIPDFDTMNADPAWIQYLDSRIPGTKFSRRQAAQGAIDAYDAEDLIELISDWKQAVTPAAVPQSPQAPSKAQAELQRQVAPTGRKTSATPNTPNSKVYTGAEYTYWHDQRRQFDRQESEVEAMKVELDAALATGRIRW